MSETPFAPAEAASRYASVTECPPVSSQIRSPVVGDVTRHVTAGLQQCNFSRHLDILLQYFNSFDQSAAMNAAAQLVFSSSRFAHITPRLWQLRWLRVPERIDFKLAVLVYSCLQGTAPSYLVDELHRATDLEARRRLRSASLPSLIVRRTRLSTIGDQSFPVAAARVWNSFPHHVMSAPSLTVF